jgi:hypothetical protein
MTQKLKKIIKLSMVLALGTFGVIGSVLDGDVKGEVSLFGPLSKASYDIRIPNVSHPLYRGVTTAGDGVDINSSGLITAIKELVDMNISTDTLFKLTKSDFYIIQVSGGVDVDVDTNGIWDKKPTINSGKLHLIISPKLLNSGVFKINILTEIIYQSMKELVNSDLYSSDEIQTMINDRAKKLLLSVENGGDLNDDAVIDLNDILLWSPIAHRDKLRVDYEKEIVPIIKMVRAGKDIYVQANQLLEEFVWKITSLEQDVEGDGNIDKKISYSYNKNANLSREECDLHADGSLDTIKIYSYDNKKRLSKLEVDLSADGSIDETTTYAYNNDGVLTAVETTILSSGSITTTTYSYNRDGYLTKEEKKRNTDGIFEVSLYEYSSKNGTLISKEILHPGEKNGDVLISYLYDEKLNLLEEDIDYNKDNNIDSRILYTYKISGNVEKKTENYDEGSWNIFLIETYNSDGLLISEKSSFDGEIANRLKSYDKHGNEFKSEVDIQSDGTYKKSVFTFNSYDKFGNLIQITDEKGNIVESRVWSKIK